MNNRFEVKYILYIIVSYTPFLFIRTTEFGLRLGDVRFGLVSASKCSGHVLILGKVVHVG